MIVTVRSNDDVLDWGVKDKERIIQNVRNIIRTRKFEVPFIRGMGINPDYIDNSVKMLKSDISKEIIENINAYEDRVSVLNVEIISGDENGDYVISVELEV